MAQRLFVVAMITTLLSVGIGCSGDDSEVAATGDPTESTATSSNLGRPGSSAAADTDDDRRAPDFPPRPGSDCAGLRSESEWVNGDRADGLTAPAGGTANYVETVINDGTDACSVVFNPCPPPGVLYTADGTQVGANDIPCEAIAYPPEDLAPGETRTETWTADLTASPGDYILYVPQRDGAVAALPVALEATTEPCPPGTIELRPDPAYEQYAPAGGETHPQLLFGGSATVCTLRVARIVLELRALDEPSGPATQFVDKNRRWFTLTRAGVLVEPSFGAIDLPPAQYEGTITVELDDGQTFSHPARLLIGQ